MNREPMILIELLVGECYGPPNPVQEGNHVD